MLSVFRLHALESADGDESQDICHGGTLPPVGYNGRKYGLAEISKKSLPSVDTVYSITDASYLVSHRMWIGNDNCLDRNVQTTSFESQRVPSYKGENKGIEDYFRSVLKAES
jgi:hypothetical protein